MEITLTVSRGQHAGHSLRLREGDAISIGRDPRCELQLLDVGVSRRHCVLEHHGAYALVTDQTSRNGTWVNGLRVSNCGVRDGDLLRVGPVAIEVVFEREQSTERHPPPQRGLQWETMPTAVVQRQVAFEESHWMRAAPLRGGLGIKELTHSIEGLQALYRVGAALNAEKDPNRLLETILDSVLRASRAERAAILVIDAETDTVRPVATRHAQNGNDFHVLASRTVLDQVIASGVSVMSNDAASDERYEASQSLVLQGVRSMMCVPLRSQDVPLGALYVDATDASRQFTDDDLDLLTAIGAQAGTVLERTRLIRDLEHLFTGAIRALVAVTEARDPYTHGHSERVAGTSMVLGRALGMAPRDLEVLELAALLHDVGKIGVPEAILRKPSAPDDEEMAVIRRHVVVGPEIVQNIPHACISEVAQAVRHHHERWDGAGYPDAIKGEEISLAARIIGVSDAWDAMTSDRPYRRRLPQHLAVRNLLEHADRQFDPRLVDAFVDQYELGNMDPSAWPKANPANRFLGTNR